MTHPSEDAMTIKGLVERLRACYTFDAVGGQKGLRDDCHAAATALETLAADLRKAEDERDRLTDANRELRNQLRGESIGRVAMVERAETAEAQNMTLAADNERLTRERDESLLMLGGTYVTQGGEHVTMVKIHNIGTPYETLEDESGVNRYSRRLSDMGRATGTAHDYSDPRNIQRRPIRAIALRDIDTEADAKALRPDAERYRWMKTHEGAAHRLWREWLRSMNETPELDAAIDHARSLSHPAEKKE